MSISVPSSGQENLRNPSMLSKATAKLIEEARLIENIFVPPIPGLLGPCQTPNQQGELKAKRRFVVDTVGNILRELYLSETRDVKKALDFGLNAKEDLASSGLNELNALYFSLSNSDSASANEELSVLYERLKISFERQFEEKKFHGEPVVEKTQAGIKGAVAKAGEAGGKKTVGGKTGGLKLDAETKRRLGPKQIPISRDKFDTGGGGSIYPVKGGGKVKSLGRNNQGGRRATS